MIFLCKKNPLLAVYSDEYKLLKYSGTAINDLGDYYSFNVLSYGKFYCIDIQLGGISQSIGLWYIKQCNKEYMQKYIYNMYDILHISFLFYIQKTSFVVIDPDDLMKDVRQRHLIDFCYIFTILLILIAF